MAHEAFEGGEVHTGHAAGERAHGGFHFFLHAVFGVFEGLVDGGAGKVGEQLGIGKGGGGVVGEGDDFEVAVGGGGDEVSAGGAGGGEGGEARLDFLHFGLHLLGLGHHGAELGEGFELVEHGFSVSVKKKWPTRGAGTTERGLYRGAGGNSCGGMWVPG